MQVGKILCTNWQNIVILDEMLQDLLECGIAKPAVQKNLLSKPELTSTKAVTVSQEVDS